MASTVFVNGVTLTDAGWFNDLNGWFYNPATQAQQEAASSTTVAVTPGRQQFHPSAAKAWINCNGAGTAINASYNVTSITDVATGAVQVNLTTAFSSANYAIVLGLATNNSATAATTMVPSTDSQVAGSFRIFSNRMSDFAYTDPVAYYAAAFGDQ